MLFSHPRAEGGELQALKLRSTRLHCLGVGELSHGSVLSIWRGRQQAQASDTRGRSDEGHLQLRRASVSVVLSAPQQTVVVWRCSGSADTASWGAPPRWKDQGRRRGGQQSTARGRRQRTRRCMQRWRPAQGCGQNCASVGVTHCRQNPVAVQLVAPAKELPHMGVKPSLAGAGCTTFSFPSGCMRRSECAPVRETPAYVLHGVLPWVAWPEGRVALPPTPPCGELLCFLSSNRFLKRAYEGLGRWRFVLVGGVLLPWSNLMLVRVTEASESSLCLLLCACCTT